MPCIACAAFDRGTKSNLDHKMMSKHAPDHITSPLLLLLLTQKVHDEREDRLAAVANRRPALDVVLERANETYTQRYCKLVVS